MGSNAQVLCKAHTVILSTRSPSKNSSDAGCLNTHCRHMTCNVFSWTLFKEGLVKIVVESKLDLVISKCLRFNFDGRINGCLEWHTNYDLVCIILFPIWMCYKQGEMRDVSCSDTAMPGGRLCYKNESMKVRLADEEIQYLEELYSPRAIILNSTRCICTVKNRQVLNWQRGLECSSAQDLCHNLTGSSASTKPSQCTSPEHVQKKLTYDVHFLILQRTCENHHRIKARLVGVQDSDFDCRIDGQNCLLSLSGVAQT